MSNDNITQTYKSDDTEEWLDKVFTRPIGYQWARLFERLHVHPNTVTIWSIIIGVTSAFFFAHGSYRYEGTTGLLLNVVGVLLLMWANFYDSADGQLARMTGQKTQLGRILDGAAGIIWFVCIYLGIVWRFYHHHSYEYRWLGIADNDLTALAGALVLLAIVCLSGFYFHSRQCGLADYYRQVHLFFIKGKEGSELDNSRQQQAIYDSTPWQGNVLWKMFLRSYVNYTRTQEAQTPNFQRMMGTMMEKYGDVSLIPATLRDEFRRRSLPLMKWTNVLTFNTRAIVLYIMCLIDLPWIYFLFEIFIMTGLYLYMRAKHEQLCKELVEQI